MRSFLILFLLSFTLLSCTKDRLRGDKEMLIGKWKWVYSIKSERYVCDNPAVITILTPANMGADYYLDFNKKGCVTFYQNTEKKEKYRIVFSGWHPDLYITGEHYFGIYLDNKSETSFSGSITSDTLCDDGFFPFNEPEGVCVSYTNYFVKE